MRGEKKKNNKVEHKYNVMGLVSRDAWPVGAAMPRPCSRSLGRGRWGAWIPAFLAQPAVPPASLHSPQPIPLPLGGLSLREAALEGVKASGVVWPYLCPGGGPCAFSSAPPRRGLLKTWTTQDRRSRWINSKEEKSRCESFNLSSASEKSCPTYPTRRALPQQAGGPPPPGVLSIPSPGQAKIVYLKNFSKLFRHTKNGECLAIQPNPSSLRWWPAL